LTSAAVDDSVQTPTLARTSSGVPGLDALIEGGFPLNRTIVIGGGVGTGKTTFGLQFIAEGLHRGDAGVFVSADQKPQHLLQDAASLGLDLRADAQRGSLMVLDASPFFSAMRRRSWTQSVFDVRYVTGYLVH